MVLAAAGATLTFSASGASAAGTHKSSPQAPARPAKLVGEQFRGDVQTWLNGFRRVVIQMRANPAIAESLSSTGTNLLPSVTVAKQEVAGLDWKELGQLQASLAHDPNWQQAPRLLSAAVAAFDAPAATPVRRREGRDGRSSGRLRGGQGNVHRRLHDCRRPLRRGHRGPHCERGAERTGGGVFRRPRSDRRVHGRQCAHGSQDRARDRLGVANGVHLALAQTLAVAVDCAASRFSDKQVSTLPHDPAGKTTPSSRGRRSSASTD